MQGVLDGFGVIAAVIGVGFVLAHTGVLDVAAQQVLARLVFFVATPCLLLTLLMKADLHRVFSAGLVIAFVSVVVAAGVYVVVARLIWRRDAAETVVGALCSSYVNAGNLGLPIAVYVLGSGAAIAPILLMQLLVLTPTAFAVLDLVTSGRRPSVLRVLAQPLRNPITIGSSVGVAIALSGWRPPTVVVDPLTMIGQIAVPAALLAYGVALRLGPRPLADTSVAEVATVTVLKVVVQPLVAWAVAAGPFGLRGHDLLAVVVVASLPTAQNIFVYATRYGRAEVLARDAIFVTTLCSVPVLLGIAALLA
ncbi:AEC family transporter [Luteipulveratus sp. YIM 133132]|uniref:AEC family transporter n=1 Tax=Luteipulveratus flavus TaxID=3031728 RepID=UPI0023AFAA8D|nr:AEC family transporter [Luteipulveratus sp. YIM 133132]MDE9366160.1 AEC family transporter [Luteipulveratus sp. YIM 133132]